MAYVVEPYVYPTAEPQSWSQPYIPSEQAWSDFSSATIAPADLHNHGSPAPFEFEASGEQICLPEIEAPKILVTGEAASQQIASESPSSPEGTPAHLSPRSSWSGASSPIPAHRPPMVQQSLSSPPQLNTTINSSAAMEVLIQMIDWPAGGARSVQAKKRPRSEHEYTKDKHLMTEKRRREDMSEAIDTIHRLMPDSRMDKKLTKVDILQDAALYFAKLQKVALDLVEENAQLRMRCQQRLSNMQ